MGLIRRLIEGMRARRLARLIRKRRETFRQMQGQRPPIVH